MCVRVQVQDRRSGMQELKLKNINMFGQSSDLLIQLYLHNAGDVGLGRDHGDAVVGRGSGLVVADDVIGQAGASGRSGLVERVLRVDGGVLGSNVEHRKASGADPGAVGGRVVTA